MTNKPLKYRVAFYRGDEYRGVICGTFGSLSQDHASLIAQVYNFAYPYNNGTFRVVEMTDTGYILRLL